ncbi:MAG: hypothetical protein PHY92_06635 [Alphaproteobacteria bacterium]|nr:hypothetical protein [Alphaproteobacteria bacterium]
MLDAYDIMGLLGVVLNLYAYGRVQWQREYAKRMGYSLANLAGALLLTGSLLNKWNLASFTGNAIWAMISLFGLYRCARYLRQNRGVEERLAETPSSSG